MPSWLTLLEQDAIFMKSCEHEATSMNPGQERLAKTLRTISYLVTILQKRELEIRICDNLRVYQEADQAACLAEPTTCRRRISLHLRRCGKQGL